MKLFLKTFGIILGIPALLIVLAKFFTKTDADIHHAVAQHSATKVQLVAWLDSENKPYSENPVTILDKQNLKESKEYLWELGVTPEEIQEASSYIYVDFIIRGWAPATRHLQYHIFFNESGKFVHSRSEDIYFGF